MARVLLTRRLPDGADEPLAAHEVDGPPPDDRPLTPDELRAAAGNADAIVCLLTDRVDAEVLRAGAGRLRVVATVSVGYDNVDVDTATELGIAVCHTPDVLTDTTADLTMLLVLAASRLAWDASADLRRGAWHGWELDGYLGRDVHGATLGLVGYGRIGRAVAERARGFAMDVLHHTRRPTGEPGFVADRDELLARADVVSLHVPGGPDTHHLVDAAALERIGPQGVLVNTARGSVVDEAALADALHEGRIHAAGLDVYEREPEIHPRLLDAPRTVLLPHVGSATVGTRRAMARLACTGAATVLAGGVPTNLVPGSVVPGAARP